MATLLCCRCLRHRHILLHPPDIRPRGSARETPRDTQPYPPSRAPLRHVWRGQEVSRATRRQEPRGAGGLTLTQEGPKLAGQHHWLLSSSLFESIRVIRLPQEDLAQLSVRAGFGCSVLVPPPPSWPSVHPMAKGSKVTPILSSRPQVPPSKPRCTGDHASAPSPSALAEAPTLVSRRQPQSKRVTNRTMLKRAASPRRTTRALVTSCEAC